MVKTIFIALVAAALLAPSPAAADDIADLRASFERVVAALNMGNLDGFLDTVHDKALSFYSCGPTSGKEGREACALDWQLFFDTTSDARFETDSTQYRVIGDTGFAWGEYQLSVNYDKRGRQIVHEGRYVMTYTKVDGEWRIAMQHNTPAGEDPQPVRSLRPTSPDLP